MNIAQKFILSNLVWIDILAPLSTGTSPRLPYHDWLDAGKIDMSRVMGCSNCIMVAIGDMMALDSKAMTMDNESLQVSIDDLDKRINNGLEAALDDGSTVRTPFQGHKQCLLIVLAVDTYQSLRNPPLCNCSTRPTIHSCFRTQHQFTRPSWCRITSHPSIGQPTSTYISSSNAMASMHCRFHGASS